MPKKRMQMYEVTLNIREVKDGLIVLNINQDDRDIAISDALKIATEDVYYQENGYEKQITFHSIKEK